MKEMLNKILLGDCYELIKLIPDNSIDLVIIDPPYLFKSGGLGIFKKRKTRHIDTIEEKKLVNNFDLLILNEKDNVKRIYIIIYIFHF